MTLAKFNLTIHYCSGDPNVNADALSRIPWDQNTEADAVGTIFMAAIDGSVALMGVYTCHERAIRSLILESPPTQMTAIEWIRAQKADPAIHQVTTLIEDGKLRTVKVSQMS